MYQRRLRDVRASRDGSLKMVLSVVFVHRFSKAVYLKESANEKAHNVAIETAKICRERPYGWIEAGERLTCSWSVTACQ